MITANVEGGHYFIALPKMLLVLTNDEFGRAIRRGKAWKRRKSLRQGGTPVSLWDETCGICGQQGRWWTSRSGYRVCMVCAPDPIAALQTLARRVPGGVPLVQSWLADAGRDFNDTGGIS